MKKNRPSPASRLSKERKRRNRDFSPPAQGSVAYFWILFRNPGSA